MRPLAAAAVALAMAAGIPAPPSAAEGPPARRAPSIGYAYPAGGRRGTTVPVLVGGQGLRGVFAARLSGRGASATVLRHVMPLGRKEQGELRRRIAEALRVLRGGRPFPGRQEEDPVELPDHPLLRDLSKLDAAGLQRVALRFLGAGEKQQPNAQIAETVELEIALDPGAALGDRDLRLSTPAGLTNPIRFQVGGTAETCEDEPAADAGTVGSVGDLPLLRNGQVMPGDADRFRFHAGKGRKVVVDVRARRLIPYLADAVPGWFQAVATVYDAKGREVAYDDDWRSGPDPVLLFQVPADGVYAVEVRDALWRGREDFVYRVCVREESFVPWLLPALVAESGETEPDDDPPGAQEILPPRILGGRIGRPGDADRFRFPGRAGEEVVAEVEARRLGSPLDSILTLAGPSGEVLAWNDDHGDAGEGLLTHQADSWLRARLPADGAYTVTVADAQRHGGPEYVYRLRVGPPAPGFEVFAVPSGLSVAPGRATPFRVQAVRRDGFEGDIEVALKDAPPGFALAGGRIPAGRDSVRVTLGAPPGFPRGPVALALEARASIGGAEVVRDVVPAEDRVQAFLYRHLVPSQELLVDVAGAARGPSTVELASPTPIRIRPGGTAIVRVRAPVGAGRRVLALELDEPPAGISLQGPTPVPGGLAFVLRADASRCRPGDSGNLIVEFRAEVPAGEKAGDGEPAMRRISLGYLPAIPFVVE